MTFFDIFVLVEYIQLKQTSVTIKRPGAYVPSIQERISKRNGERPVRAGEQSKASGRENSQIDLTS